MKFLLVLIIVILIVAAAIGFYKTQIDEPIVSNDTVVHTEKRNYADNNPASVPNKQSYENNAEATTIHQKIEQAVARTPLPPVEVITDDSMDLIPLNGNLVDVEKTFPLPTPENPADFLKDLSRIPAKITPKRVTVKEVVVLNAEMDGKSIGTVTVKPETEVDVKELKDAQIIISAGIASTQVDPAKTDFQQRLEAAYKKNFDEQTDGINQQRQTAEQNNQQILQQRKQYADAIGKPPIRRGDGIIPAVLHGLLIQGAPLIDPKEIVNYGDVRFEVINNEPYWTSQIELSSAAREHLEHRVHTLFGDRIEQDGNPPVKALIRLGRVVRWVAP